MVALAGWQETPRVFQRRRIVFAAGEERSVYHHAAEEEPTKAEALIARVRAATQANAAHAIGNLIADLQRENVAASIAVVPVGTAKLPEKLEDILAVHTRMHAAEGAFYRDVVARGCAAMGLEVHRVVERELPALVADLLDVKQPALAARLKDMGAALGPPWSEDYRLATLAAWLHVARAQ